MRDPIELAAERLRERLSCDGSLGAPHRLANAALASVLPLVPSMIDVRVGGADARIYSRAELRELLADFAAEILLEQAAAVPRYLRADRRVKGARG